MTLPSPGRASIRLVIGHALTHAPRDGINLVGCAFIAIPAVASCIVPQTGSILDLAAANWNTVLGAACFLAGAVTLVRHDQGGLS